MATSAGSISVNLEARVDKLKSGLKQGEKSVESFRKKLDGFIKAHGIAIAAGVAGITALVIKTTKAASDLQETQAKFDTVFRGSTEIAEKFAKELRDDYLLSEQASKQFLSSIQDTLVPMGIARESATDLSAEIVKLAADLGSFNNVPTEQVVRDLQSALVGNTETVKKYGVVLKATDISQVALLQSGKDNISQLTQAEKVQAAYNIILEGTEDAQGDVKRTSDSYANRLKFLIAQLEDLQVTMGNLVIGPMTELLSFLTEFVKKQNIAIVTIREATTAFGGFGQVIKSVMVESLREAINALFNFVESLRIIEPLLRLHGIQLSEIKTKLNAQIDSWQATGIAASRAAAAAAAAEQKKREQVGATTDKTIEDEEMKSETLLELAKKRAESDKKFREEEKKAEKAAFKISEDFRKEAADAAQKRSDEATKRQQDFRDVFITTTEDWVGFAKGQAISMFNEFGQGVADMILEGRKFSDVMKQIWQGIARAVIAEIAKMIAKMLVLLALRKAIGFFAGGPVGAAVAQEGGLINEPSIITGLRSGKRILAGEAGTEAIVPVSGGRGGSQNVTASELGTSFRGMIGGGGGGMNISFNISGQFLEASPAKWQQLMRESIIPEIRRFTMSSPTGPFNRRRGVA